MASVKKQDVKIASARSELQLLNQGGHFDARSSPQRFKHSCQVLRISRDATTDTAVFHVTAASIINTNARCTRNGHRSRHSTYRNSTWTLVFATTTTAGTADTSVDSICGRNAHWWFAADSRRDHATTESGSNGCSHRAHRTHNSARTTYTCGARQETNSPTLATTVITRSVSFCDTVLGKTSQNEDESGALLDERRNRYIPCERQTHHAAKYEKDTAFHVVAAPTINTN